MPIVAMCLHAALMHAWIMGADARFRPLRLMNSSSSYTYVLLLPSAATYLELQNHEHSLCFPPSLRQPRENGLVRLLSAALFYSSLQYVRYS